MSKKIEELQTEDVKSLVRDKLTKPRVAAADSVVAILFEVAEKLENKLRVKIFDSEIARLLVKTLICKGYQQTKAVTVDRHGAETYVSLLLEALRKELLQQNGKRLYGGLAHDVPLRLYTKRVTANASNSGVAVSYQYVSVTLTCPR
ncbi:hypothetical protein OKW50_008239 [Paraburkholderia youngii]|uniref:hypothetical protein n=1 Tax=Paraburkholderia youngii TaxID=2782701 RepID=UPI003D22A87B